MAVAERQGRAKEGLKTRSGMPLPSSEQAELLAKPNLHRAGPGGGKNV